MNIGLFDYRLLVIDYIVINFSYHLTSIVNTSGQEEDMDDEDDDDEDYSNEDSIL